MFTNVINIKNLSIAYIFQMIAVRPITQHGLSGLPTSDGRKGSASGKRQIKDKRYWLV